MVYQQCIKETQLQKFITNNYVSDMLMLGWTLQSRVEYCVEAKRFGFDLK